MPAITIPIKRINYVDTVTNKTCPFLLEDIKCAQVGPTQLKYTMICGLTAPNPKLGQLPTIATRYIANTNIAIPLSGNETLMKKQFEMQRRLTRATSVYYRICECPLVARLSFVIDTAQGNAILSPHLTVFTLPKVIPNGNSVTCNSMQMSIEMTRCIMQFMLSALWSRHII